MQLSFLGRGAAFNPLEGNTAAYWREEGRLLLIDCGETVFRQLIRLGTFGGVTEAWIAVSHLHSDHCGSLGSTVLYCAEKLGFVPRVIYPAGDEAYLGQLRTLLALYGVGEGKADFVPDSAVTGFKAFSSFRCVPCVHAPGMICYSFQLETPHGGVYYTADTANADGMTAFLRTHPDFEAIYAETVNAPRNPVHLPIAGLAEAVAPEMRHKVHIMHLNGANCAEAAAALGFAVVETEGGPA